MAVAEVVVKTNGSPIMRHWRKVYLNGMDITTFVTDMDFHAGMKEATQVTLTLNAVVHMPDEPDEKYLVQER